MTLNKGMLTSKTSEWATPIDFFNELNKEFNFNLDVCANADNNKCLNFYSIIENGLEKPWIGNVWCNPPYGRQIGLWVKKGYEESQKNSDIVVMLLPSRTDTKWFHDYVLKGEIRFIKGRLKFNNHHWNAPFPSLIVIFKGKRA